MFDGLEGEICEMTDVERMAEKKTMLEIDWK